MDAVELNYPVDVSKFRVPDDCETAATSSIERCRDSHRRKDGIGSVNVVKRASWDKFPDVELCRDVVKQSGCEDEELSRKHDSKGSCQLTPGSEFVKSRQRAGKMSRNGNGSSKRLRVAPPEDNASLVGVDDVKDMIDMLGSSPLTEKNQIAKQRQKRGEKKNLKNSMKPRFESFSMKSGFASAGVGAGGSNFLGVYGLKSEVCDITKLVDDISLDELLDSTSECPNSTSECPNLGKDKGKKPAVTDGNFLDSIRKAWSVLPLHKCPNVSETDSVPSKNLPTSPSACVSVAETDGNGEKEDDTISADSNKAQDSGEKPEISPEKLDSALPQHKDILERLALPPPKDLESLLLDATKPSIFSRNTSDLRAGKQITRRPSLPPFPWSHSFNGHSRTNSDAVKCLLSRSSCQGRWVKIAQTVNSPGSETCSFTDLESFTYDPSLVPVISKAESSENRVFPQAPIEPGPKPRDQINDERCPKILAAAKALCNMLNNPRRQNLDGFLRWPKKPSQKAMKARKSEKKYSRLSITGNADLTTPSKRPRIAAVENRKGTNHTSYARNGTITRLSPTASNSQRKVRKLGPY